MLSTLGLWDAVLRYHGAGAEAIYDDLPKAGGARLAAVASRSDSLAALFNRLVAQGSDPLCAELVANRTLTVAQGSVFPRLGTRLLQQLGYVIAPDGSVALNDDAVGLLDYAMKEIYTNSFEGFKGSKIQV